ncbi:MAG: hypothetical protein NVS3B2_05720 [Ramlibacter sp.]
MQVNETDLDLAANDLGPLAWVLDELRKSLDTASAALRRFVRDANLARGSDMASVRWKWSAWVLRPTCCAGWKPRCRNSSSVPSFAARPLPPSWSAPGSP